jgi:uptake hydrogenase large subunit
MTRLIVGPFNRVEGDLEVHLDIEAGRVQSARVNAPMYRGFEQILQQRHPMDALAVVPRICGICSVSQSVAAARALADMMGVQVPDNGVHAINLIHATENLADHLTHFYLFFMPDFARPEYAARPWHAEVRRRFAAQQGEHVRRAVAARQRWFTLLGTLAGKWPHSLTIQPGGSSRPVDTGERIRLLARIREFRAFLEQTLFAASLERIAALGSEAELDAWLAESHPHDGDFRLFLTLARENALELLGKGPGLYLSYGAYLGASGEATFRGGLWDAGMADVLPLDTARITEDATHAWLADEGGARHPQDGLTLPAPGKTEAYTWNKAPRMAGRVLETGAIARQLVAGHSLVHEAVARTGGNVTTRVLSRLLELALVVPMMERWLAALRPGEPYYADARMPDAGQGVGLTEAARGSLGHWVAVQDGKIRNYQIVAPTSWNFSPRDAQGQPGALELALAGTETGEGAVAPVAVQHIVRSFDPCMVCTVH